MGSTLKHLLLLLLVLIRHVDSAAIVKSLPGLEGRLPFELETGFVKCLVLFTNETMCCEVRV